MAATASTLAPLSFDTAHEDVIHDAQFDYYGKRLATASSDRTIKIFSVEPGQPERLQTTLTGHEGPVWQVCWAHPKFGSIMASCSYDGTVVVWKETGAGSAAAPAQFKPQQQFGFNQGAPSSSSSWIKVKEHRLHDASVNSIAWAPHEFGLSLACASSDGQISVITYRPEDSSWDVKSFPAHQIGCNAVSWCASPASDYLAAMASGQQPKPLTSKRLVSGGCDNLAKVWVFDEGESAWKLEASLEGHSDWVRDVAWAPSGNIIASGSQDKQVFIWKNTSGATWTKTPLSESFPETIWRLSWSTAGNLLAVSCGDNTVSLWREGPVGGAWELVSKADQASLAQ